MPKLKTNKAAKKRFKLLKSGKIKRKKAFLRHILTSKAKGRKRGLRKRTLVAASDVRAIKQLFPYG
ncbi:MAG TPA: 50S ribosomal protein L35 [bacterium]|nr:50S ribosomal protein L35 [bacterium]